MMLGFELKGVYRSAGVAAAMMTALACSFGCASISGPVQPVSAVAPTAVNVPVDLADTYAHDVNAELLALRSNLDPTHPGRGILDYPGRPIADVPKAYGAVLKAEIMLARRNRQPLSELGRVAGDYLLKQSDERRDGFAGWGVPAAWDAYGDGSVNPKDTKYTISTAVVTDALLDWAEADSSAPRDEIYQLVAAALTPYLYPSIRSPAGLFPYSLESADLKYDTFNPAGYLAGAMQRFAALDAEKVRAAAFKAAADRTVAALIANKKIAKSGAWYWQYSVTENVPNDLAHAGYIMRGLRLYVESGGTLGKDIDVASVEKHLQDFIGPESGHVFAWPIFRTDVKMRARSYDLGFGLYLACTQGDVDLQKKMLRSEPAYRNAEGRYLKYPPVPGQPDDIINEYEAYLYLALAACVGVVS